MCSFLVAQPIEVAAHRISFTDTLCLVDDSLHPLSVASLSHREQMVDTLLKEIGMFLLPKQRLRVQARVVKRTRSRYERKKLEHWHAPPFELDLDIQESIVLVE